MNEIKVVSSCDLNTFDVFIYTIGYENRSSYYMKNHIFSSDTKVIAFDYGQISRGLHSYDDNLNYSHEHDVLSYNDIGELCEAIKSNIPSKDAYVGFDVTSLDRSKIAEIIKFLFLIRDQLAAVQFVYCPSEYKDPHFSLGAVGSFGPVLPQFAGDVAEPRRRLALLIGFGYEYGRTVGAIESLEPDKIYGFMPVGTDPRYEEKILENNLHFEFLKSHDALKEYNLSDTKQLYKILRGAVELELAKRSVLIVPMGPKIFAAISILIGMIRHPSVMVWRHSSTTAIRPETTVDATASGTISKFSFVFSSTD